MPAALPTLLWHTLNTPLLIMLHCFSAQERRCGFRLQGSGLWLTSGHVEASFQLFPKSSSLVTTMWSRVVKSFLVWSSKFPHRPHTVPCRKKDKSLQLEKILREETAASMGPRLGAAQSTASILVAYLVRGVQLDEDGGLLVPDNDDARAGLHHQVLTHFPCDIGHMVALFQLLYHTVFVHQLQLCPLSRRKDGH